MYAVDPDPGGLVVKLYSMAEERERCRARKKNDSLMDDEREEKSNFRL